MSGKTDVAAQVAWGPSGLVPAVLQDRSDGRVLMVGYMDAEALAATLASGDVHFHSRSRARLWRKGETSGNVLRLRGVEVDCDGDALLFAVEPTGPTCHTGTRSCFDPHGRDALAAQGSQPSTAGAARQGFDWLETLWATIDARAGADPAASYTARLLAGGVDSPARKVAEEATEVLMAAKDDATASDVDAADRRSALTGEVADLLYHTLVLLRERGLQPAEVVAELRRRHKP